jgi:predicted nucleic acid-binding protein
MKMLYLDTSSLIKLYIDEPGSDEVRQDLSEASAGATSLVTYAETRATLARLRRLGNITPSGFRLAKRDFDVDRSIFVIVPLSEMLCRSAADLAERHGLRGFDSIHLATFLHLANNDLSEVRFSTFDRQLNGAATRALRAARRSAEVALRRSSGRP